MIWLLCIFLSRQVFWVCSTILAELIMKQRVLLSASKEDCISRISQHWGCRFKSFHCWDHLVLDVHRKSREWKLSLGPWTQTILGLPNIRGPLKIGEGYLGINLKRYLGTHLCRDERLMKHFSVITLYLSGKREKKYPIVVYVWVYYGFFLWFFVRNIVLFYHLDISWMIVAEEVVMIARHGGKCLRTACVYRIAGKQEETKSHFADFLASSLWWVWYEQDTSWNTITKYYYFNMISSTTFSLHFSIFYHFSYFYSDGFRPACPTSPLSMRIVFDFKPGRLKSQKCRTEKDNRRSLKIPVNRLEL